MKLTDIITASDIFIGVSAPSKLRLFRPLANCVARRAPLEPNLVCAELLRREQLGCTGIGDGVAIPHAYIRGLSRPMAILVRLKNPVDFEAVDDFPVDLVFVILAPADHGSEHLSLLSRVARKARSPAWRALVRAATTPDVVADSLAEQAGESNLD